MTKVFFALLSLAALLFMSGCDAYSSKYNAFLLVHSNTPESAFMQFDTFKGTMVFRLKSKYDNEKLKYSAKLGAGSANVDYDYDGQKTGLFSVKEGDDLRETDVYVGKGRVYVIVETDGECKEGDFNFEIYY
ncbi:MAG: hypothetical protein K6G90_02215 [Clostridia bacterium]|nr:hypothetical protein [Clostridia bacterium]